MNAEDGTAVDSVMIGGRMILDRGRFTTVDYEGLGAKAQRAVERMRSVNAEALELASRLEAVVGSFCNALGSQPYHVHRFVDDGERAPRRGSTPD